jgi:chromosomal replication initiator protein
MKANFILNDILIAVCKYYDVTKEDIKGTSRVTKYRKARQMYVFTARNHTDFSYDVIGNFVDKDHSTAKHSFDKVSVEKEIYSSLRKDIQSIEAILYNSIIPIDVNLLKISLNNTKKVASL